jgi:transcriptional regulator with GAF, ATPase, and Fis domain
MAPDSHSTDLVSMDGRRALSDCFEVTVIDGPDRGATVRSTTSSMTIGSDGSCDLVLRCGAVSRFHCEITLANREAMIRDLNSTNGTRVDGVRIVGAYLRRGAVIEVGRDRLQIDLVRDTAEIELYPAHRFGALVGQSVAMRAVFARLARAATSDATVLMLGETGTGKDTAAEAIHQASARAGGPFVIVDCGTLPAGIAESELFGHLAGAFTGAQRDRIGVFEAANGGTVFLDEIGELPTVLQPKLLRVLERREVVRIGEAHPRSLDIRVIAATRRDLRREVNQNRFRADLYFRLAVVPIQLPPLRERIDDIPMIANAMIEELSADDATRARLRSHIDVVGLARMAWPGNIRELKNHVERIAVLDHVTAARPVGDPTDIPFAVAREAELREFERRYVTELLARCNGDVAAAARKAGLHRSNLYRMMQRAGLG